MEYISVRNYEKYQNHKRANPSWIKLHMTFMDDPTVLSLSPVQRMAFVYIIMLASQFNNKIPYNPTLFKRRLCLGNRFTLEPLLDSGLIVLSSSNVALISSNTTLIPSYVQPPIENKGLAGHTETETEAETDKYYSTVGAAGEEEKAQDDFDPFADAFSPTPELRKIPAPLKAEKITQESICANELENAVYLIPTRSTAFDPEREDLVYVDYPVIQNQLDEWKRQYGGDFDVDAVLRERIDWLRKPEGMKSRRTIPHTVRAMVEHFEATKRAILVKRLMGGIGREHGRR